MIIVKHRGFFCSEQLLSRRAPSGLPVFTSIGERVFVCRQRHKTFPMYTILAVLMVRGRIRVYGRAPVAAGVRWKLAGMSEENVCLKTEHMNQFVRVPVLLLANLRAPYNTTTRTAVGAR